jgi:hypothetical protein
MTKDSIAFWLCCAAILFSTYIGAWASMPMLLFMIGFQMGRISDG